MEMNLILKAEPITYDGPGGLKVTAKRYTADISEIHGLTLVFAHCIGSHKEQWELVIKRLFLLQRSKSKHHRIREAVSFDWQNHGDAALLNAEALKAYPKGVSVFQWAPAIALYVKTHLVGHRIVPMGHSAGAAAVMLTTKEFPLDSLPYIGLVLVEPTMITRELYDETRVDRETVMDMIVNGTLTRREAWPSRDEAFTWLSKKLPWVFWDPRILRLYTEYGLHTVPSLPGDPGLTRVHIKCDRKQEAVSYPDTEPHFEATTQLGHVCHTLPVHFVFGDKNDIVPEYVQDSLGDVSAGRKAASVTIVEDTGHFIAQEQPEGLATALAKILDNTGGPIPSKL